jgi:tetratricopeptide (TPR) repeat protein
LLPVLVTAPSIVAGERLWYQGNRIYPMCFAFTVLVFVFLKRFIENKKTKIFALCAAAVFIGTSSYISYARADVFKDGLSFFGEILKESPQHVQARKFHALAHSKNGDIGYAIEELRRLNEDIGFDFDETNYFLAFWLFIDEKYEEAAEIFDLMIKKKQIFNGQPYAGAALSNYFLGKREESLYYLELFAKAANIAPAQAKQYFESYYAYVMRQKEVYLQK